MITYIAILFFVCFTFPILMRRSSVWTYIGFSVIVFLMLQIVAVWFVMFDVKFLIMLFVIVLILTIMPILYISLVENKNKKGK